MTTTERTLDSPAALAGAGAQAGARPCRVAHLHSSLGVYGAEQWTLTLLRYLDRRRFATTLVTLGAKPGADVLQREAQRRGFATLHLPIPGRLNPRAVLALRRFLVAERIEVLHTHGFKSDVIGCLACAGLPVALVTTVHGWSADEGWRIRAYEAFGRLFLRRFHRVYPLSPALLQDLRRTGVAERRTRLIMNAVDTAPFDPLFEARRPRSADDPFEVVYVGRLCRPKGIDVLLRAFAQARFPVPARLTLVGEGPERAALEQLRDALSLGGRVRFTGALPEVAPVLAGAHAMVLPSFSEGIPRVVMEAFAAGVMTIGTDIPGIRQLVTDGETGVLVPVSDAPAIARALERACADPQWAWELALRARDRVLAHFSAQRMAREFEQQYHSLAPRAGPDGRTESCRE